MTTNPHIRAGSLPPTELHRIDASLLPDDRTVMVAGEQIEFAGYEPDEDGPEEMLAFLIVLVMCIGAVVIWRFA
jgi:hypothetical protein